LETYQPNDVSREEQVQINTAIESAQDRANLKSAAFIVTESLDIAELTRDNQSLAVEIIQPNL
jgi:hypothetical protein